MIRKTYGIAIRFFSARPKALISWPTESHISRERLNASSGTYPKSRLKIRKYRVSSNSPEAICKDRKSSLVVRRPKPWAVFAGTDADDRLN